MLTLQSHSPGGYQSGQMGQTVNLLAYAYGGSNPSPPTQIELKQRYCNLGVREDAHFLL